MTKFTSQETEILLKTNENYLIETRLRHIIVEIPKLKNVDVDKAY